MVSTAAAALRLVVSYRLPKERPCIIFVSNVSIVARYFINDVKQNDDSAALSERIIFPWSCRSRSWSVERVWAAERLSATKSERDPGLGKASAICSKPCGTSEMRLFITHAYHDTSTTDSHRGFGPST